MSKTAFRLLSFFALSFVLLARAEAEVDYQRLVDADALTPVRPVGVNGQDFWNRRATHYLYPPSLKFPAAKSDADALVTVSGAKGYRTTFAESSPTVSLVRVWKDLPVGAVTVVSRGVTNSFWRQAPYRYGAYPKPPRSYAEALSFGYRFLVGLPNPKSFLETGKPSPTYRYNSYPSKMHSALIMGMLTYARRVPSEREKALKIARAAADYLISISQPKGAPFEYFSPTYQGENYSAKGNKGLNMLIYPARAATAYVALYRETKEKKYLEAAERTAATYARLQGEDGTWPLKVRESDGQPVNANRLLPYAVVALFKDLAALTGRTEYDERAERALAYIMKGPVTDWNWEGQFEDVGPAREKYKNLSKHPACDLAIILLKNFPNDPQRVALARELVRWSEDQFVCWEEPCPEGAAHKWSVAPGVFEQYSYRVPVDASAAKMVTAYLALYRVTGNPLDLAKARTLGDSIVRSQNEKLGMLPTIWLKGSGDFWLNCMISDLEALERLAELDPPQAPDFLANRVVVSDTNRFTCGSGPAATLSPDGRRLYVPYLTSPTGFGECHDAAAVADVPLDNPGAAKSSVACLAGDVFCGERVKTVLVLGAFPWKGNIRLYLDINFNRFGYRDWDPQTQKVVGEGLFKCRAGKDAAVEDLSPAAIAKYLKSLGLKGANPFKEAGDRCIFQSKPQWRDGALYGFVTSSCSHPILFSCRDGETFEFLGAVPTVGQYECQLAILDGTFYAVLRGATGDNFWISSDEGRTWRGCGRLPDGLQRQRMMVWKDQVLIGYSAMGEEPNRIRRGRNNMHLILGRGPDLTKYREVLHAVDPLGIVYFDLVGVGDELHVLWSNSERFPDKVKWGAVQGKDQVLYSKIGKID